MTRQASRLGDRRAAVVEPTRRRRERFGAGIVLQTEGPIRLEDLVEVAGIVGVVVDVTGRATVIDTFDGRRARIPNSEVLGGPLVNYSERGAMGAEVVIGVEYGTDLDRARIVVLDTVRSIDGVMDEPAPEALVAGFAGSSINLRVLFWHEPSVYTGYVLTDRVSRAIDRTFRQTGIVIAFPQVVVWESGTAEADDEPAS